jgi:hypothetical protein
MYNTIRIPPKDGTGNNNRKEIVIMNIYDDFHKKNCKNSSFKIFNYLI